MGKSGMMKLNGLIPFRVVAIWMLLAVTALAAGDGLSQEYCSSDNTGSDYDVVQNIYQSNGACYTQCSKQGYAFAVVQYQDCWCSDYIPADQQDTGNCNQKCPGFPDDLCGNKNDGLYGYIKLPNVQPSGTAGASTAQASSSAAPSTSDDASSAQAPSSTPQPQSSSQQPDTSYSPSSSDSLPPTSTSSSLASSTSSTITPAVAPVPATTQTLTRSATPSPVTSIQTVTISGALVTQTVTSTPVVVPDNSSNQPLQRKQISGGAIAGIAVGAMIGIACILAGAFFLWRRRREDADDEGAPTGRGPNSPRRNISVLSRTGLLSRPRQPSFVEKDDDPLYAHTGNNSVRHSMLFGAGATGDGVSPVSPLESSHDHESRRYSRPMVYDQRLNPSALFANQEANGSRVSIQDNNDYSRPLGVMNPDIRASFDSRISRA